MQPYKQSISRESTYNKLEVGRTDATLLAEELIGIYSTPTPKGRMGPKN